MTLSIYRLRIKNVEGTTLRATNVRKEYIKAQLVKKIEEVTNALTKAKGLIKDIQSLAQSLNIPIEFEKKRLVKDGKTKGNDTSPMGAWIY